jgi:predicted DNA-binding protein (MmcQ/YjbR family)
MHAEVIPGFHMNKKHWNTVSIIGKLAGKKIQEMIDHSYAQVVKGLPKKEREGLE